MKNNSIGIFIHITYGNYLKKSAYGALRWNSTIYRLFLELRQEQARRLCYFGKRGQDAPGNTGKMPVLLPSLVFFHLGFDFFDYEVHNSVKRKQCALLLAPYLELNLVVRQVLA